MRAVSRFYIILLIKDGDIDQDYMDGITLVLHRHGGYHQCMLALITNGNKKMVNISQITDIVSNSVIFAVNSNSIFVGDEVFFVDLSGNINFSGVITGNGSGLTSVVVDQLDGGLFY